MNHIRLILGSSLLFPILCIQGADFEASSRSEDGGMQNRLKVILKSRTKEHSVESSVQLGRKNSALSFVGDDSPKAFQKRDCSVNVVSFDSEISQSLLRFSGKTARPERSFAIRDDVKLFQEQQDVGLEFVRTSSFAKIERARDLYKQNRRQFYVALAQGRFDSVLTDDCLIVQRRLIPQHPVGKSHSFATQLRRQVCKVPALDFTDDVSDAAKNALIRKYQKDPNALLDRFFIDHMYTACTDTCIRAVTVYVSNYAQAQRNVIR